MGDTKFAVTDYNGRTVSCSTFQWDYHVAARSHTIMERNVDAVKDTIKHPDIVIESITADNREELYKVSSNQTYDQMQYSTKVVVEYGKGKKNPETTVGSVVTAFPVKTEKINKEVTHMLNTMQPLIDYDKTYDVMNLVLGDTSNSYGDEDLGDIVIMKDMDTDAITGYTIMNFSKICRQKSHAYSILTTLFDVNDVMHQCGIS